MPRRPFCFERLDDRVVPALTADFSGGLLSILNDGNDDVVLSVMSGSVKVNGLDPTRSGGGSTLAADVSHLSIIDGNYSNTINLSAVTLTDFTSLESTTINAGAGDDSVIGSEASDLIAGGTGDDTLEGGLGGDVYFVLSSNNGHDVITEYANEGADWIDFSALTTSISFCLRDDLAQTFSGGSLTLADPSAIENVIGTSSSDHLCGNDSANIIVGGAGNDTIVGFAGNDLLAGSEGADYLAAGDGNDILAGGSDSDFLTGGSDSDFLTGDAGDDILLAGEIDFPSLDLSTYDAIQSLADVLLGAWSGVGSSAERLANLQGDPGATNPIGAGYQLHAGVTALNDESVDLLAASLGDDAVFLDSREDLPVAFANDPPLYRELDPNFVEVEATFARAAR